MKHSIKRLLFICFLSSFAEGSITFPLEIKIAIIDNIIQRVENSREYFSKKNHRTQVETLKIEKIVNTLKNLKVVSKAFNQATNEYIKTFIIGEAFALFSIFPYKKLSYKML